MAESDAGTLGSSSSEFRTVIVVDRALPAGRAANAAAVLAVSLGAAHPDMPGPDWVDADGGRHPGLFPKGLPILGATPTEIATVREAAATDPGVLLIDFPEAGQTTTDYEQFREIVARTPCADLRYVGIALRGPAGVVRTLTKRLSLLR
jgi:hypothetical protein